MARIFQLSDLSVTGKDCVPPIEIELNAHKNRLLITHTFIDPLDKTATLTISDDSNLSDEEIEQELRFILQDWLPKGPPPPPKKHYHGWQAGLGLASGSAMMAVMLLGVTLAPWLHILLIGLGSAITLALGVPSYNKAFSALFSKKNKINMDSLFALSTIAAISLTIAHIFVPVLPMLIDAALMIFGFRHFGLWLEQTMKTKTLNKERFVDRGRKSHDLSNVKAGSIIQISPDQCIPLNGTLEARDARVSFALHTGKTAPYTLKMGSKLFAGMIVHDEMLTMKVTALEDGSYLRQRDLQLIHAQSQKAPIEDFTQKILTWFVPSVLFMSAAVGLCAGFFLGINIGLTAALYFLVCACPCALGMVTPLAIKIGLDKTTNQGMAFNKAKGLQAAGEVDTVIFDLNGTLTQNQLTLLTEHTTVDAQYFPIIHAMEEKSTHAIGRKIFEHTDNQGAAPTFSIIKECPSGMTAVHLGRTYKIGNANHVNVQSDHINSREAQHVIYFSVNDEIKGHFLLKDELRDDASKVIDTLRHNNLQVKILTGADHHTAQQYAKQLTINPRDIVTGCTPAGKSQYIRLLQEQGHKVAMIGDAGNDTNAIAAADFGVIVSSSSTDPMAKQEADASIHAPSLLPLLNIFAVSKQTMRHIKQNLLISFAYNTLSLGYIACAIFLMPALLSPAIGAALMAAQSACILANAYRIKREEEMMPEPEPKTSPGLSESSALSAAPDSTPDLLSIFSHYAQFVPGSTYGEPEMYLRAYIESAPSSPDYPKTRQLYR